MSSRRSKPGEFVRCNSCNVIFTNDVQNHSSQCELLKNLEVNPPNVSEILQSNSHSFICSGGLVSEVETDDFSSLKNVPKSSVLINPSVMKLCKINICSPVVVYSQNNISVFIAWPSKISKKLTVHLDKRKTKLRRKSKVFVYPYPGPILEAREIEIDVSCGKCTELYIRNEQILYHLSESFVCPGTLVALPFTETEKCCKITINNIVNIQCAPENENIETNISKLSHDISSISLNDSMDRNSVLGSNSENITCANIISDCDLSSSFASFLDCSNNISSASQCQNVSLCPEGFECNNYSYVSLSTNITINFKDQKPTVEEVEKITFENIGGLNYEISFVQNLIQILRNAEHSQGQIPNGVLICGISGVGKTIFCKAVCNASELHSEFVTATDIYSKKVFAGENVLPAVFTRAWNNDPSIICIDELDLLCEMFENNKNGMLSSLASLMDETLRKKKNVLVLANTRDLNRVDVSLRSSEKFDTELKFPVPSTDDRKDILRKLITKIDHNLTENELNLIAENANGFTGLNILQIIAEAQLSNVTKFERSDCKIGYEDLKLQMKNMRPHVLQNNKYNVQKVLWSDIGGMENVKQKLRQVVELPLKNPEIFKRFNIVPPRGILLYGPPGCSKTMIVKALTTETNLNFIPIKGPELFSKWVGESEKAVRDLFKRAKEAAPCVIFFDEVDALVAERGSSDGGNVGKRIVTQLLTEVDGAEQLKDVIIIAATNRPDMLDPAILRPGRLDYLIYVPLPDADTRREIFQLKFKKMPISREVDIESLVARTSRYSGAEIVEICREAGMESISENYPEIVENPIITPVHFELALKKILPRIPKETLDFYEAFSASNFNTE